MKKSVILDIFHGVKGHMDTMTMPAGNKKNSKVVCDTYDDLKEKLSPELFKLHQRFVDALECDWSDEVDFFFAEGFKLGLLIGVECIE